MKPLEDYIREKYPDILTEYQGYTKRNEIPKIGDKVKTLVGGYGGNKILAVTDIGKKGEKTRNGKAVWGNDYIELNRKWLCEIENWWERISVIE